LGNLYKRAFFIGVFLFFVGLLLVGCSTEKNTAINRLYHGTCARYNGLFNAKEYTRIGLEDYRRNTREDFSHIIPIEFYPLEEDVVDFYPVVDTAIKKCQTVISKHSMPTASKPSKKKTEHANWVDQNWIMIGKARYIRRDYELAFENFEYIKKFFMDRSSTYEAEIWMAKCQIQLGRLVDAQRTLQKVQTRYDIYLSEAQGKNYLLYKRKVNKMRNKKGKIDVPAPFPKRLLYDLNTTKAELAIAQKNYGEGIRSLEEALKYTRKKQQKARLYFIIGQLMQREDDERAREFYTKTIKKSPPFEMGFKAKINRALVGGKGEDEIIRELQKMNGEQRYMEYRDQIYYAMAKVELGRSERDQAKKYLTKSTMYSLDNPMQKGISYELQGDLAFEERNYINAQRYFDSSARVIPESYRNFELIQTKAEKLAELVQSIDIVYFEDSVQRIAGMNEDEREKFLEKVIEQLKEEERIRKQKEAERAEKLRELQMQQMAQGGGEGNRFYFSNPKSINEGFEEFRQYWGARENEDNWRRSNKPLNLDFDFDDPDAEIEIGDAEQLEAGQLKDLDPSKVDIEELTPEILMVNVPINDSMMQASNERLLENLYKAGMIYKEQLNEEMLAADQFDRVVNHGVENEHNVLSAFQLYEIFENKDQGKTSFYKSYIMDNYPKSDYANYLRDPDYFIKRKELDALAQKEYLKSVERYERGLYYPVIMKAENVIAKEPENRYRAQYFILKAMAMGRVNADKSSLIPILEQAIEEYPETPTAERAEELIGLIQNGVPAFEPIDFSAGSGLYNYSSKDQMHVFVYIKEGDDARDLQTKVSDFNKEFFSRDRLNTKTQILNKNTSLIQVSVFKDEKHANDYLRDFKKTKKHLQNYRNNRLIFISNDNLKVLLKERKMEDYEAFFERNY
jgi:hypothetical protein